MARIALLNTFTGDMLQTHRLGAGHLGLGYVAACLLRDGHEVVVLDAKNERLTPDDIAARLAAFRPDIFGATAMTHEVHCAAEMCALAKRIDPAIITMVGGPHATALPERTLREFGAIDIAVIGEGEETAREIARCAGKRPLPLGSVAGIAYRDGGAVARTQERPWIANLDQLPFPAWRLFPKVPWPLFTGRGCPFGCVFCQRVLGRKVRMRSVDNVLAEIDAMEADLGAKGSWFQDETFALNRPWADEFLTKLEERNRRKGYVWRWEANSRANLADRELYRRMKGAGCLALSFGVESGNPKILKRIGKSITKDMAVKAIADAKRAGLKTHAFFIVGHPGERVRTAIDTARFAASVGADDIAIGVMVPYPGTEVWEMAHAGKYNYRLLTEDWRCYDKYFGNALEIEGLSHRQMEMIQAAGYVWFYLRKGEFRRLFRFLKTFRAEAMVMLRRLVRRGPKAHR